MYACLALVLAGAAQSCFAADAAIRPALALSSDQYHILASYKEYSQGFIQGNGSTLKIAYHAGLPLTAYIAIVNADGTYNPADLYEFALPAANQQSVTVDLTALTTWSPGTHSYFLSFLSNTEHTDASFSEMTFMPGGAGDVIRAAAFDFVQIEPYWVSSAHLLRGYRILNVPFAVVLGGIVLFLCLVFIAWKHGRAAPLVLMTMLTGVLLYDIRFTADLTVWSADHLRQWTMHHEYGEAQDIYSAADTVKDAASKTPSAAVSVCFDSTDYYAKLLRYLVYPVPVTMTGTLKTTTTQVLVTHKINWTYQNGALHCGAIDAPAVLMKDFPDGSHLYSVHPAS